MIFKINFFLFSLAQSNIVCFLFVIAKHYANVSNSEFGVLALLLPAIALFAKPISCSLTDAHGIHKQFLIGSLTVFGISYGSIGIIALIKDPADHEHDSLVWWILCGLMIFGYNATACCYCMNDALASNYARKNNISYSMLRIWSSIGWACGGLMIILLGEVEWLPFRLPGIIIMVVCIVVDVLFLTLWPYEEDFEMFHDGSTPEQRKLSMVGPNTMAYLAQAKPRGSISHDMLEKIKAGRSKSVGNLPRFGTAGVDFKNKIELQKPQMNDIKEEKEYTNFQCQMILMKMISSKHKSFIRYLVLFTIFGIVYGMQFTYQFDYFKARVAKDDEEFAFLANFCMIAQSIFGEIPIYFIANHIIRLVGANASMSLALITFGLRCFFYAELLPYLNKFWVIIPEGLQGPSVGLYWILIVEIGSHYALMVTDFMPELRKRGIVRDKAHEIELSGCLRASMIGMMSSSMEGLGVALGSFVGGIISGSLGYDYMWNLSAILSISAGFINIFWDIYRKLIFFKSPKEEANKINRNIPTITVESSDSKL